MKKLDFYFKPTDASSTKSFDTSQAGVSDSLPESLPSPLDSQKPKASTHVGPPYHRHLFLVNKNIPRY
jgi:hypothetical protein